MVHKKKIWGQAFAASAITFAILIGWIAMPSLNKVAEVQPISITLDKAPDGIEGSPRERAMEEHGEPMEKYPTPEFMKRVDAIRIAEDLAAIADSPDVSPEVREQARVELDIHLMENFPTAAAEPKNGDPENGDEHAPSWGDILRNVTNESVPYFFILVQFVIGDITRRRLKKAKEATA